jgi:DNA-binding transcriptional regulator LsrR (DeoR family)
MAEKNSPRPKVLSPAAEQPLTQAFRAAELYYRHGEPQRKIAQELGVSPSTVSRLLEAARAHGLVHFVLSPPGHDPLSHLLQTKLRRLGHPIRTVLVADGEGRALVGYAAARHFEGTAPERTTVVLDGGWTVADFVSALPPQTRRRVTIVPIAADPPSYRISASELMTVLAAKCVFHSLQKIPHLVYLNPGAFLQNKYDAVVRAARDADFVVLGVGPWQPGFTALEFVQDLGFRPEAFSRRKGRRIAAVSGYLPLTAGGELVPLREIEPYLPRAIGLEALRGLARRADRQLLVIAASEAKAGAVLAAVRAGLCNTLVLDRPLALALVDLLRDDPVAK